MRKKEKKPRSLTEKIRARIEITKVIISILSVLLFTVYIVYMLYIQWGQSVYLYIVMGFIGLYIVISLALIIIIKLSGRQVKHTLKNYKSGLKILKYTLVILNFMLTVSILSISAINLKETSLQQWVLVFSLLWAVFQIIYQITRIVKRHRLKKKKKTKV